MSYELRGNEVFFSHKILDKTNQTVTCKLLTYQFSLGHGGNKH